MDQRIIEKIERLKVNDLLQLFKPKSHHQYTDEYIKAKGNAAKIYVEKYLLDIIASAIYFGRQRYEIQDITPISLNQEFIPVEAIANAVKLIDGLDVMQDSDKYYVIWRF